jgi:hypothetical protein
MLYPEGYFELEQVGAFLLVSLQYFRIFCGSKGNKTETSSTTFFFCLLVIPCLVGNIYYIVLQTYALVFEVIMGVIIVICLLFELIVGFFAAIDFKSLEKAQ